MTQPEYEQKRAECWIEFCKEHPIEIPNMAIGEAFSIAFDRAYALGKQKKTITQDDIEKAAEEYSDSLGKSRDVTWNDGEYGFIAGANFALGKKIGISEFYDTEDAVIQGWVCRDKEWDKVFFASDLYLSMEYPTREEWAGTWRGMGAYIPLNTELFPDLTWDDEPLEVEIIIKRKKNG